MRLSAPAFLLAAALLSSCQSCNTPPTGDDGTEAVSPGEDGVVVVLDPEDEDAPAIQRPLDVQIRPVGPAGVTPRFVLFQLSRPVFSNDDIGTEPAGVELEIDPPIEGSLRVTAPDLLEFTPATAFQPSKGWTVRVKSITHGDVAEIPDKPWEGQVVTQSFEVVNTWLRKRDASRNKATVEMVFRGEVDAEKLRPYLTVDVDGTPATGLGLVQGEPHSALVEINTYGLPGKATEVHVELAAGVPYLHDDSLTAPAYSHTVTLPKGPSLDIQSVSLREGNSGFYVEVVCDDDAAGGERYWWDRDQHRSYWVSSRCMVDEELFDRFIRTNPPSKLSVAPGPAGFRVFGSFDRGPLEVTIDAGVTTVDGGVLYESQTQKFNVPARSSTVSFASKGRYLPRSSWKNLAIQHMNVDEIRVRARHVPEQNLVFWLTGNEPMNTRTSDLKLDTRVAVHNTPDTQETSWIPVGELIPDPKRGVYEISLGAGNRSDAARLMLTDMHLVAKATRPGPDDPYTPKMQVWALDVHSGDSLSNVEVKLVRASGKSIGTCRTAGDRGCAIHVDRDAVDKSPPVALIARNGDDLTYIKLADLELDTPDDTTGIPYTSVLKYQAPLYTDRGVYRPGDTAHIAGVVRNDGFVAPDAGLPVVIKLFDPKGREIKKRVIQTNAGGLVSTDIEFADYQITGHYRATAEIGELVAGETTFQVEEFVPERLRVLAEGAAPGALLGEPVAVKVTGEWLFGGAAKGARTELRCRLEPGTFAPENLDGFTFGPAHLSGRPEPLTLAVVESALDEEGKATIGCPAPEKGTAGFGPATLVAEAAVFEGESGRTTVNSARVPVHPSRTYIGLDTPASKSEAGKLFEVQGRVVDWDGKPAGAGTELTVEVYRMEEEYSWWWDDEGSSNRRQLRPAREVRETVKVGADGTFSWKVTPEEDSAGTMIRVRGTDALTELFVEGTGRRYYWSDSAPTVDSTPRPMRPAPLELELPERIKTGEVVDVAVAAPYPGRILWTVETDTLVDAVWMDAVAGENTWRFKVEDFTPNVYVSAFLVKDPHLESKTAFLPDRAFAVESVEVIPEAFEQLLTLNAPDEVRPYSTLEVEIDVGKGAGPTYATIAVVDEGILSLTKFEDPDPLGVVFQKRALGVSSYETIGWTLLMEPGGPSSTTGGDGDSGDGGRVQMVKPVALWSGIVEADDQGKVKASFDIPGYRGEVRVMAVTSSKQRIGHASKQVTVADPLVLQTTLPRFLLTDDTAQIPVMVANRSGKPQEVQLALVATELQTGATPDVTDGSEPVPILQFLGAPTGTLKLADGESGTAVFQVRTRDIPGAAHLEVTAVSGALRSREELDIPIQAASSETREIKRRALDGGTNALLADYDGWLDGTDRTTLWVTSNPYAHAMTHLRYLVRYPFG